MNYMEQVAKMLGVELRERFNVEGRIGECHLEKTGLWYDASFGNCSLLDLLTGELTIIKKPWKPKNGGRFYFVGADREIWSETYQDGFSAEMMYVRVGNCYRSQKEITPELVEKWAAWYEGGECPVKDG